MDDLAVQRLKLKLFDDLSQNLAPALDDVAGWLELIVPQVTQWVIQDRMIHDDDDHSATIATSNPWESIGIREQTSQFFRWNDRFVNMRRTYGQVCYLPAEGFRNARGQYPLSALELIDKWGKASAHEAALNFCSTVIFKTQSATNRAYGLDPEYLFESTPNDLRNFVDLNPFDKFYPWIDSFGDLKQALLMERHAIERISDQPIWVSADDLRRDTPPLRLITNLFVPALNVAEALHKAPDADHALAVFWTVNDRWTKVAKAHRDVAPEILPPSDVRLAVEQIFRLKEGASTQCTTYDDLARYLHARAGALIEIAKKGWAAATQGGNIPKDPFPVAKPAAEAIVTPSETTSTVQARDSALRRTSANDLLIAALTKHHDYDSGSCMNWVPVGNNELSRLAGVSNKTASEFFKQQFGGHAQYKIQCGTPQRLIASLKTLNNEFSPKDFNTARTPNQVGEQENRDE